MKTMPYVFSVLVLALTLFTGCASVQDMPTVQAKAHAALVETNKLISDVTKTAKEFRDVYKVFDKGSALDKSIRRSLVKASDLLDDAQKAFVLGNFTATLDNSKSARELYFEIRSRLPKEVTK